MKWLNRALVFSPSCFGLCRSKKDFRKALKRLRIPPAIWPSFISHGAAATTHFFERSDGMPCAIVCVDELAGYSQVEIHALLVHEAVHVWRSIRRYLGETAPSEEFEAYALQNIAENLMEAYNDG